MSTVIKNYTQATLKHSEDTEVQNTAPKLPTTKPKLHQHVSGKSEG